MTTDNRFDKAVHEIKTLRQRLAELERLIKYEHHKARERKLISVDTAADLLGIHPRNVHRMAERGEIYKYNEDGSIKTTNKKTRIFFDKKELLEAGGK